MKRLMLCLCLTLPILGACRAETFQAIGGFGTGMSQGMSGGSYDPQAAYLRQLQIEQLQRQQSQVCTQVRMGGQWVPYCYTP